jgi:hypothetical protein
MARVGLRDRAATDGVSERTSRFTVPTGEWRGPIPVPDLESEQYWRGLREREIRILQCADCRYWIHPPLAACPRCHGFDLHPEAVEGVGTVYSYTVVHREFAPGIEPRYVAALVELPEQPGLRLLTNVVNCDEDSLQIGLPVQAVFHDIDDTTALLFFEPSATA